ncbi:hypothetical protein SAMN06265379_10742 [Saccharicrinis carchari]|uniref:Uncharacterized protein n=1 Tax=Saccharicrinis carchari TaxID=1168039 RepID=A0A521DYL5_SACCC|nr:hypothetical protein [Saccharicrinis carchari]SMO76803.1 hypothetical protein SAMN06265379_10742 [Saccharicrinis carchari]
MKNPLLLILLFSSICAKSQNIPNHKIYRLNQLGISTQNINLHKPSIQNDLNKILSFERKRKTNKTWAVVLSSVSAVGIITGSAILLSNRPNAKPDNTFNSTMGGIVVAGGAIYAGVSLPFWVSSRKWKKKRNKLKRIYQ